ncbi:MAG: hypothetical protein ACKVHP_00070, partial [Verrucomicrobiales bacterium]
YTEAEIYHLRALELAPHYVKLKINYLLHRHASLVENGTIEELEALEQDYLRAIKELGGYGEFTKGIGFLREQIQGRR